VHCVEQDLVACVVNEDEPDPHVQELTLTLNIEEVDEIDSNNVSGGLLWKHRDDAELGEVGDVALHDDVVRPVGPRLRLLIASGERTSPRRL
jgi:hypothetical protein